MSQIKYLINACLILGISFVSYSAFQSLYSVPLVKEKIAEGLWCGTVSPIEATANTANTEGKKLFQQNCQTCHALDKTLTGPALRGFTERGPWNKKVNIYKWIKNPAAFMVNNKYTQNLKRQYGVIMPAFMLSNNQVDAIVAYISESGL